VVNTRIVTTFFKAVKIRRNNFISHIFNKEETGRILRNVRSKLIPKEKRKISFNKFFVKCIPESSYGSCGIGFRDLSYLAVQVTHVKAFVYICICICLCIYMYMHMGMCMLYMYIYICICICIRICRCICIYIIYMISLGSLQYKGVYNINSSILHVQVLKYMKAAINIIMWILLLVCY